MIEIEAKEGLALCSGVVYKTFTLNVDAGGGRLLSYSMIKNKEGMFLGGNGDLFNLEDVNLFIGFMQSCLVSGSFPEDAPDYPFVFSSDAWAEMVGAYYEDGFNEDKKNLNEIISGISKKYTVMGCNK